MRSDSPTAWGAISSLGILGRGKPHPRFYGTSSRVLGRYVREKGVLSLQGAVRKMTSMPAQKIGLRDRGLIREGMAADLVIFDPHEVRDEATFTDPHRFPAGINYVIVNGEIAVKKNKHTGALPGRALKKTDCTPRWTTDLRKQQGHEMLPDCSSQRCQPKVQI